MKIVQQRTGADVMVRENAVTIGLIVINCIVFFVQSVGGDTTNADYMLQKGASFYPYTLDGQLWRLFTSMFMHFDIAHLLNNMLSLLAIGSIIEKAFGKWRYLVIYLGSGLGAGLISALYHQAQQELAVCAGASGAIFGLDGALVCLALFGLTNYYGISSKRVIPSVILSLVLSSASNVDGAAHIGGLVIGLLISLIMTLILKARLRNSAQ